MKAKDVKAKLKTTDNLPSVTKAKATIASEMTNHLEGLKQTQDKRITIRIAEIDEARNDLVTKQKAERRKLKAK